MTLIKGSYIRFGNYPQQANGEVSPIEWLVLDAGLRKRPPGRAPLRELSG